MCGDEEEGEAEGAGPAAGGGAQRVWAGLRSGGSESVGVGPGVSAGREEGEVGVANEEGEGEGRRREEGGQRAHRGQS